MFTYLREKIITAPLRERPFPHLFIENFFSAKHFAQLTAQAPVKLPIAADDAELISMLHEHGYQEITFPGTTLDIDGYLEWHKNKDRTAHSNVDTCDGYGVAMRLGHTGNSFINELRSYLESEPWLQALAERFGLELPAVTSDSGVQKYLDGYEISPHPDTRRKALTYMVNINPSPTSEKLDIHTRYLSFLPDKQYIKEFWRGNPGYDRCWVPWDWCTTEFIQHHNNSIVIFSPGDDTLHAIKADYGHCATQRTQLYGNLWFKAFSCTAKPSWRDYLITETKECRAADHAKVTTLQGSNVLQGTNIR